MKCEYSYAVELRHVNKIFHDTVSIFRDAVSFCIDAFESEWFNIECFNNTDRKGYAERLIHSTKNNVAKYQEFDKKFHKLPSYVRRNAMNTALGHLSSYHSNVSNWYKSNCEGKKPSLQIHLNKYPTFYKGNMYDDAFIDDDTVYLKLYRNHDWVFVPFMLKHTDMAYIRKHCNISKMSTPTLERRNKKWFLRFCFKDDVSLPKKTDTVLAVDLGINTDAACSVMDKDGTVLSRKFINFKSEKDHLYHTLNKIRKTGRIYGSANTKRLWRHARFHNDELAGKVAKAIVDYASKMHVDTIVFEHLDTRGKKKGKSRQKLHMWKKNTIQAIVQNKAHRRGIRIARVCAFYTSRLAYDGSGTVIRGKDANLPTYELCRFPNGKVYNCDLSASYNIGARFFIREYQKSTSVKKWSQATAKVPSLVKRILCTYNTYLELLSI